MLWWNYPVWALSAVLTGALVATYVRDPAVPVPATQSGKTFLGGIQFSPSGLSVCWPTRCGHVTSYHDPMPDAAADGDHVCLKSKSCAPRPRRRMRIDVAAKDARMRLNILTVGLKFEAPNR